jgi:hypothetical protein
MKADYFQAKRRNRPFLKNGTLRPAFLRVV